MENYIIANYTDTGRVRSLNEDSMDTFECPNGRVVVVCDGMGGQNAGDMASQLAIAVIKDILCDNKFDSAEEAITKSVTAANQAILHRASQSPNLSGMGSTCVILIIRDGKVYYGSVGDSRIYYIAGGAIRQITKDQSYVQTLVDAGEITQEEAEHHKDKNQITNALGVQGMTPPVIGQMPITPEPGSVFLLCSDGLSGMVKNSTLLQVVSDNNVPLQDRALKLVNLANEAGGLDNITVQLVEFPENISGGVADNVPGSNHKPAVNPATGKKNKITTYVCGAALLLAIGGFSAYYVYSEKAKEKVQKEEVVVTPVVDQATNSPGSQSSTVVKKEVVVVKEEPRADKNTSNDRKKALRSGIEGDKKNNTSKKPVKSKKKKAQPEPQPQPQPQPVYSNHSEEK